MLIKTATLTLFMTVTVTTETFYLAYDALGMHKYT